MKIIILSLLLVMVSCAKAPVKHTQDVVELDSLVREKKIEISNKQSPDYGPSLGDISASDNSERPVPLVGINFLPSFYYSFGYSVLLKELEEKKVKISVISGSGMGAVIAALYAKEKNSNKLEWKLYALTRKLKGSEIPFSKDWKQNLFKYIDEEFQDIRIEKLPMVLLIPLIKNGELRLVSQGKVKDILKKNFEYDQRKTYSSFVSSPVKLYDKELESYGLDLKYHIAILPERLQIKFMDGLFMGFYSRVGSFILKNKDQIHFLGRKIETPMDELGNLPNLFHQVTEDSADLANSIAEDFNDSNRN